MKSLKVLCFLFFTFITTYNCSSKTSFRKSSSSAEREMPNEMISSLVNYIDSLIGVKQIDFVESIDFENFSKPIQVKLKEGKLICTSGRQVVPIKVLERTLVAEHAISSFYDIRMVQNMKEGNEENEENEILLPMKLKNNNKDAKMLVELLTPGSEGYLICLATNAEALLIPKIIIEKAFIQYA